MNPADHKPARRPVIRLLGPALAHPATSGMAPFLALAAFFLSLWQMAASLQQMMPGAPKALIGLLQLAGGLTGFIALLLVPGLIMEAAAGREQRFIMKQIRAGAEKSVKTTVMAAAVTLWSFLPLEIYLTLQTRSHGPISPWLAGILLLLSLLYFPMALKMLAVSGKLMPSLLVSQVLERMTAAGQAYFGMLPLFWLLLLAPLPGLLLWKVPLAGPVITSFLVLYIGSCAMFLLGTAFVIKTDIPEKNDEDR